MAFVRKEGNEYYVVTQKCAGYSRTDAKIYRVWWAGRWNGNKNKKAVLHFSTNQIRIPNELVHKKFRIKLEEVKNVTRRSVTRA